MTAFDVDSMLSRILNVGAPGGRLTHAVAENELMTCLSEVRKVRI